MDHSIWDALQEWALLESVCYRARSFRETECRRPCGAALSAKEEEILAMRAQTKQDALAQVRFCAMFLERNGGEIGGIAATAIRNAANVLGWAEAQ
jgi:hypothetical protein